MSTFLNAFRQLRKDLTPLYDSSEAGAISRQFLEAFSGKTYSELLAKDSEMNEAQLAAWSEKTQALQQGRPLQQVLGFACFLDRKFLVNEHTLIPRPETEELVAWVVSDWKGKGPVTILDVGTGSGCIAISLSLAMPEAKVTAIDISIDALKMARTNNEALGATVAFQQLDFLKEKNNLPSFDVVVSNPPYIPISEKEKLDKNVRDFEPGTALFVPDEDPLIFYRQLGAYGSSDAKLQRIYCELHQDLATDTKNLFLQAGYEVSLRKDMFDNYRMLRAQKNRQS